MFVSLKHNCNWFAHKAPNQPKQLYHLTPHVITLVRKQSRSYRCLMQYILSITIIIDMISIAMCNHMYVTTDIINDYARYHWIRWNIFPATLRGSFFFIKGTIICLSCFELVYVAFIEVHIRSWRSRYRIICCDADMLRVHTYYEIHYTNIKRIIYMHLRNETFLSYVRA